MIQGENIDLNYSDGTCALKNVNISISPGELVFIVGPSGSGKTSLLKLLMGIEFPSKGTLQVLAQDMNKSKMSSIRKLRRIMGPIFQEFRLIKGRTAIENVMTGMRFLKMPHQLMYTNAQFAMEKVGLTHKNKSKVENLSYGESQRVAIARAVARNPKIILADEPTGNLDQENANKILDLLASFVSPTTSVIITTHATHLIEHYTGAMRLTVNQGVVTTERIG